MDPIDQEQSASMLPVKLVLFVGIVLGGWYFFTHYQIRGLEHVSVESRQNTFEWLGDGAYIPTTEKTVLRVATFNPGPLDHNKLNSRSTAANLVRVIRRFDIVAIQDIHARNQSVVVQLVDLLNAEGSHYDYILPEEINPHDFRPQSAFLFDRATVLADRETVCLVESPDDRFEHQPLVASFSARGVDSTEAFTFTLINVHVRPDPAEVELNLLDDVYRALRDNGRGEDDVLVLGTLGADDRHLGQLGHVQGLMCSVSGTPSTTRGVDLLDNILFDPRATSEFTGRSGVFDIVRELNLPLESAREVSEHQPVWIELSVREGGRMGQVASWGPESSPQ